MTTKIGIIHNILTKLLVMKKKNLLYVLDTLIRKYENRN